MITIKDICEIFPYIAKNVQKKLLYFDRIIVKSPKLRNGNTGFSQSRVTEKVHFPSHNRKIANNSISKFRVKSIPYILMQFYFQMAILKCKLPFSFLKTKSTLLSLKCNYFLLPFSYDISH